jgi:hypothetical protein
LDGRHAHAASDPLAAIRPSPDRRVARAGVRQGFPVAFDLIRGGLSREVEELRLVSQAQKCVIGTEILMSGNNALFVDSDIVFGVVRQMSGAI